jgi:hypothetical protein
MLRITLLYQKPAARLSAVAVVSSVNGFVLRSLLGGLSGCSWRVPAEILRRFYSSLPPLFAARRCAALLYVCVTRATRVKKAAL